MVSERPDPGPFLDAMAAEGLDSLARAAFARALDSLASPDAVVAEGDIEPVEHLPALGDVTVSGDADDLIDHTVVIKLNGGLGTSMGLERAKSLLEVRDGQTFLDLIVAQADRLAERRGHRPRLLFMNSFSTTADTSDYLAARHPHLGPTDRLQFVQNKVPKVDAETLALPSWDGDPALAWCPPGHGDLYTALVGSGTLQRLVDEGIRYAFVSNADNLGATLDADLLGWFAGSGAPFAMEVTRRTEADRKGGHLARRRADGRLVLRESAQTAAGDADAFSDIDRHRYFNTNNLWLDLEQLAEALLADRGTDDAPAILPLPVMRNHKPIDPRDPSSRPVIQLETAMGAAIECFDDATAIVVDRSRFAPVKTTDDLFTLRSDAYEIRDDGSVGLVEARAGVPPTVDLDPAHHKLVDGLDELIPDDAPSLVDCVGLRIRGRWRISADASFAGTVALVGGGANDVGGSPVPLPAGRYVDETVTAERVLRPGRTRPGRG